MSKYRAAALWKRYKIADRAEKSGRELWQGDFWAGAEPKDVQELPDRVKAFLAAHSPTVVKNDITAVMTGRDRVHWYLDQLAAFEYCPLEQQALAGFRLPVPGEWRVRGAGRHAAQACQMLAQGLHGSHSFE